MRTLKNQQQLDRRQLLKTIASSGISMQALKASTLGMGLMYSRAGLAQSEQTIKRAVFVFISNGAPPGTYTATGQGAAMNLGSTAKPLEEVKENCLFFDGCTSNVGNHGHTSKLLGRTTGSGGIKNTLDVELERLIGSNTSFPAIRLGVETDTNDNKLCRRDGVDLNNEDNPITAFARLFGNGDVDPVGKKRAQSVLDHNRAEIAAIKQRLGSFELARLEEQETAIRTLEGRLEKEVIAGCSASEAQASWNSSGLSFNAGDIITGRFTDIADLHSDSIALAFKCDLTRVASLSLGTSQAEHVVADTGHDKDYHNSIHGDKDRSGAYTRCRAYLTARLAYLIKVLRDTNDSDGNSLLDSTIVLQVTDMGNGDDHDGLNCPFTMAGGKNAMAVGRTIAGADNNHLLNTVAKAMGVEGQVPNYGNVGAAAGILL